jgi:hypothetical protein
VPDDRTPINMAKSALIFILQHETSMNLPLKRPRGLSTLLMQRQSRDYIGLEDNFRALYEI